MTESDSRIYDNFQRLCCDLGAPPELILDRIGLFEGRDAVLSRGAPMSLEVMDALCNGLWISHDDFLDRNWSVEDIESWIRGDFNFRGEYLVGAGSRVRTVLPVLESIRRMGGPLVYRSTLRKCRVHENSLSDPERFVSLSLLKNVLSTSLKRMNLTPERCRAFGTEVTRISANRRVASEFRKARNFIELYEWLFAELTLHYEKNFDYRILKGGPGLIRVAVKAREEMQDAFSSPIIDSRPVCLYRQGVAVAHTAFLGEGLARLDETHCVHRGDPCCVYELRPPLKADEGGKRRLSIVTS